MSIANAYHVYSGPPSTTHDLTGVAISNNSDRILGIILCSRGQSSDVLSSVVLDPSGNNESCTLVASSNYDDLWVWIYRLVNATVGSGLTLRATTSSSAIGVTIYAIDMYDMDTTAITDGYQANNGSSTDPEATFTPSANGCHIQASFISEANAGPSVDTWSGVTGQTTTDITDQGSFLTGAAYATQTTAGSITTGFSSTPSDDWACGGVAWPVATGGAYDLTCDNKSFTFAGQTTGLTADRQLSGDNGSFSFSGQTVSMIADRKLTCESGTLSFAGQEVTLSYSGGTYELTCDAGSLSFAGQTVGLTVDRTLTCDNGSFSFAGQVVGLTAARKLACDNGTFSFSGQAIGLTVDRLLTCDNGSFSFAGQAVSLLAARSLTCAGGSYSFAGQELTFDYSGNIPQAILTSLFVNLSPTVNLQVNSTISDLPEANITPSESLQTNPTPEDVPEANITPTVELEIA